MKITSQPSDTTIELGNTPTLSIAAETVPADPNKTIAYQWYSVGTGADGADEAVTGAASTEYSPSGLTVGEHSYYCTAAFDGYTAKSTTVKVTVTKHPGSIISNSSSPYASAYTYTASIITSPAEGNFTKNGGALTFAWYNGNPASGEALTNVPSEIGTYTLRVTSAATDTVESTSIDIPVTISALETDATAVLAKTNKGMSGWYKGTVTVNAPEGYTIHGAADSTFAASFTTDTSGSIQYWLKQTSTGFISAVKSIDVSIDATAPAKPTLTITTAATDHTVTLTASTTDDGSGVNSYSLNPGNREFDTQTNKTGVFELTGLTRNHVYSFTVYAMDVAGNSSVVSEVCSVTTAKESIKNADVTLTGGSFTYNGTSQTPSVAVTLNQASLTSDDFTVSYSNTNGGAGNTTNAGTITVTAAGKGDFDGTADSTPTYTIAKAVPNLSWGANTTQNVTYSGEEAVITVPAVTLVNNETYNGQITYTYKLKGTTEEKQGLPVNAGNYEVKAHIAEQSNYTAADSDAMDLTIAKSSPVIAFNNYAPAKTYDGTALAVPTASQLTISGAGYKDVAYTWYQNSVSATNQLNSAPVNAGNYILVASIAETSNTNAASVTSNTISISKAELTLKAKDQTIKYGQSIAAGAAQIDITGTLASSEQLTDITLTASGKTVTAAGTITPSAAVISGNGTGNYSITYQLGILTITKADPVYTVPTGLTATYGQDLRDIALPAAENGTWQWSSKATTVGEVGTSSFPAKFVPADTANYNTITETVTVTVAKANTNPGTVTYSGGTLYDSMTTNDISGIEWTDHTIEGMIVFPQQNLIAGTNEYNWTFVAMDNTHYDDSTGTIVLDVKEDLIEKISVDNTVPSKKTYTFGDTFDKTGLKVTATYASGKTADVTENTAASTLHGGYTSVTLSYTEKNVTKTCTVDGITVNPKQLDVSGMQWKNETVVYDGMNHKMTLTGTLPAGVAVTKTGDHATNAGTYTATAVFTIADGYDARDYTIIGTNPLVSTTGGFVISPKQLTWNTDALTAVKKYDGNTSATITGTLAVTGEVKPGEASLAYSGITGVYDNAEAGTRKVTATVQGATVSDNYILPEAALEFAGTINPVKDLPVPPESTETELMKLEQEIGISEVPEALKNNPELNTPMKIEAMMRLSVNNLNSNISSGNIEIYDVRLQFSTDGGKTWIEATAENFPASGITVTLPYPAGTNAESYDFVITHMFTTGANAGNTENLSYIRTENGLQVKVMSLSPIAIGYAEKTATPSKNTTDSTKDTEEYRSANTADRSGLSGWSFLMLTSVLVIALGLKWKHKMS